MGLIETEAIVLRTHKLDEADKIVSCLTREAGLVRGVARGARRLKNRFGASLEPCTLVALTYFEKEGRELVSLKQAEILRSHFHLTRDAETVAALEYMCQLALEFAPPHEPNEKLFRMVRACLDAMTEAPEHLHAYARYFEVWILKLSGFLPDLSACQVCGKRFGAQEISSLQLTPGSSLRCGVCASGAGLEISVEAHAALRWMLRLSPSEWAIQASNVRREVKVELAELTKLLITRALEKQPRGQASFVK